MREGMPSAAPKRRRRGVSAISRGAAAAANAISSSPIPAMPRHHRRQPLVILIPLSWADCHTGPAMHASLAGACAYDRNVPLPEPAIDASLPGPAADAARHRPRLGGCRHLSP
ncbi:hypothetical protein G6F68_017896 [Rhizopus microsporus]|nr:hypothetical protein G6F68_017896 [Rhizopus microsporus]